MIWVASTDAQRRVVWAASAVIFVGLSWLLATGGSWQAGPAPEGTDYLRLQQVLNLVHGQAWFDLHQPRLTPPQALTLNGGRLADLPYAAIILIMTPWLGQAAILPMAGLVVPLGLLALCAFVAPALSRGLIPARRGWWMTVALLTTWPILNMLRPMALDRQGATLLMAMVGYLCLLRYSLRPHPLLRIGAGLAGALCLALGGVGWWWACLTIGAVAVEAAWYGGLTARHSAVFGLSVLLGVLLVLPVVQPVSAWPTQVFMTLALPQLVLAVLTAVVLLLQAEAADDTRYWRCLVLLCCGVLATTVMVACVPAVLTPRLYAGFTAANAADLFGHTFARGQDFSWNRSNLAVAWPWAVQNILVPSVAAITALILAWRHHGYRRRLWGLQLCFLLPLAWCGWWQQAGVVPFLLLTSLLPLAWLGYSGWSLLGQPSGSQRRPLLGFLVLGGCLGFTPIMPLGLQAIPLRQIMLYPAFYQAPRCDPLAAALWLQDPAHLGTAPARILAPGAIGAAVLFWSRHTVVLANDVTQTHQAQWNFFATRNLAAAQHFVELQRVNYVVLCRAGISQGVAANAPTISGTEPEMATRLRMAAPPPWLVPVPWPLTEMMLYAVAPRAPGTP